MFDISFTELLLSLVVALIVLGPERLPKVARTVGRWTGQARAYLRNLSSEIDRETQFAEIKRQLEQAQKLVRDEAQSMRESVEQVVDDSTREPPVGTDEPASSKPPPKS